MMILQGAWQAQVARGVVVPTDKTREGSMVEQERPARFGYRDRDCAFCSCTAF